MWHGFHTRVQRRIVHANPNAYTYTNSNANPDAATGCCDARV